ncbi:MAG: sensor histidine kinase [Chitinophagaceae bacterium]
MRINDLYRKIIFANVPKSYAQEAVGRHNRMFITYFCSLAAPLNLVYVIYFYRMLAETPEALLPWRWAIIYVHSCMFFVMAFTLIMLYFTRKQSQFQNIYTNLLPHYMTIVAGVVAVIATVYDQMIIDAVFPYVLFCFFYPVLVRLHPIVYGLYLLLIYLALFALLPDFQKNQLLLNNIRLNAFTVTLASFLISLLLWRSLMLQLHHKSIIEKQQQKLASSYQAVMENTALLNQSNETKSKLLSIIAHDLKGSMGNMRQILSLMDAGIDMDVTERKLWIHTLKETAAKTQQLLNNLLLWSRSQLGNLQVRFEHVNINKLVHEQVQYLHEMAVDKKVTYVNQVPDYLYAWADINMTGVILRNLLANAMKYVYENGTVTVRASVDLHSSMVKIEVEDNGIGMEPAQIEHLFTVNTKSTLGTNKEQGSGLGLLLCSEFAKQQGGYMQVTSILGKGSIFCCVLPVAKTTVHIG